MGTKNTLTFDAVENATSYKIYSDGSLVDEVSAKPSYPTDCLTFVGESGDFTLKATNKEWDGTLEYSTDHSTWSTFGTTAVSSANGILYLRGSGNTKFYSSSGVRFVLSASAACHGNIQTLLQYDDPPTSISASNCYYSMFRDCTGLTQAPKLPATTLAKSCYNNLFYGCTGLTKAPELPATTLAEYCYYEMFEGCTGLTKAPELPATTLASYCYGYMFEGCTGLTKAPELPATALAASCYSYMFYGCTGLTKAPELPATTLAKSCYSYMFRACTGIKLSTTQTGDYQTAYRIPTSGTGTTASNALSDMFYGTGGTFTSTPSINTTYYGAW